MDAALRNLVRDGAGNRCEYCLIDQENDPYYRFHIEHIVARQHGGATSEDNLALACHHCNPYKGPNLSGVDPQTRQIVRLFHPRTDRWEDHFVLLASTVRGITPTGRATVALLAMNEPTRRELRSP